MGMPAAVIEVLRFCVVVFFAGLGYELSRLGGRGAIHVGPVDASGVGILLGAAVGYVIGGVIARLTARRVADAERALAQRSAEQVLAGLAGGVLGVLLAGGLTWPVLLVGTTAVTLPLFLFVCVAIGSLGYRLGLARRESVLGLLGPRTGLASPKPSVVTLPRLLDTSVAIDGRIIDVVRTGFVHGTFLVAQPVLDELQGLADAGDDVRRAKGRRGLEALEALRRERGVDLEVIGDEAREVLDVDAKLVRIALDRGAALLTLDTNLARVASLAGVRVMNLHALAVALRPPVVAGDTVSVLLLKAGREPGQAVGYLDDGTMVVAEKSRQLLGAETSVQVTSVLTTANGRMVFARPAGDPA